MAEDRRAVLIELIDLLDQRAPAPAHSAPPAESAESAALLSGMSARELLARADDLGIPHGELDAADQQRDWKGALVGLILRHEEAHRLRRLRAELSTMSPRLLIRRAEDLGVANRVRRTPPLTSPCARSR